MPVTYTNRKEKTYTLCQRLTKTGKVRYIFMADPAGDRVEQLPEEFEIRETSGLLCDVHAEIHPHDECAEPVFLVNSPRMGMCGYTGPDEPPY
jgi:hypothetical protein